MSLSKYIISELTQNYPPVETVVDACQKLRLGLVERGVPEQQIKLIAFGNEGYISYVYDGMDVSIYILARRGSIAASTRVFVPSSVGTNLGIVSTGDVMIKDGLSIIAVLNKVCPVQVITHEARAASIGATSRDVPEISDVHSPLRRIGAVVAGAFGKVRALIQSNHG
jgi:hypothetical protein